MRKAMLGCLALLIANGCSTDDQAAASLVDVQNASDLKGAEYRQICTPDCGKRECGDDGCDGECGKCSPSLEQCSDDGICEPFVCNSSKDCPGELVCAEGKGECVACVGDEDCPEGEQCGGDSECHASVSCDSDKDCKVENMLCDKEGGLCVECLKSQHCGDDQYCDGGYCIDSVCTIGERECQGNDVVACPDGSGWTVQQTCSTTQHCEGGECHYECDPGAVWCEGSFYKVCAGDGSSIQYEEDCAAKGQYCFGGICIDSICLPGANFCVDDDTTGTCSSDGMSVSEADCPADSFCTEGNCNPWVCEPGTALCVGTIASMCNQEGSAYLSKIDCAGEGLACINGVCSACIPDCVGRACGDDSCGGSCGSCTPGVDCLESMSGESVCGTPCDLAAIEVSNIGCEFWAVDLDNVEGGKDERVAIVVSVPTGESKNAELTFTNMATAPPKQLTPEELMVPDMAVEPGATQTFMMPYWLDIDGSVLDNRSVRIESSLPVTVHQFNPLNGNKVFTNDASLLLPSEVGGLEYLVMSWPQRTSGYTLRGNFAVVATQEGTTLLKVWPTTAVKGGTNVQAMAPIPPTPYEFNLEQGDVLGLETDGNQGSDLTGTRILADKKVNVFGGHECANIPLGTDYCDHIEQQLFPVHTWGTHYIADAFTPRNANQKDVWRIVAGADDVQISLNPQVSGPYVLNKGQWVEFYSGTSVEVNATGPVLLGHYLQSSNYSGFQTYGGCSGDTGIGDPALTLSVPAEQYQTEYIVLTPDAYVQDYVNIIAKNGTGEQITLDGAPLSVALTPVGGSGFGVAQIPVTDGIHTILSSGEPFGVTVYGYDCDVSYAYPGGLSLKATQ